MSVVIPIYGRIDLTEQCLRALEQTVDLGAVEVVVVDNGSTDGSGDRIAEAFGWVKLLTNATNLGFAAACNQGARAASHDVLVFLNNDTEGHPGWLGALVDTLLGDDGIGLVGPKLLFPDGTLQHAGMWLIDDRRSGALNAVHRWYREAADRPGADRRDDLRLVTGAVMAVRRALFDDVGGFDQAYWNGCEDVELCLRVGARGLRVVYEPASVLVHHEGASGAQRWTKVTDNLRLLTKRWQGRTDVDIVVRGDGSVFPGPATGAGTSAAASAPKRPSGPTLRYRGSLFGYHSLAQVNRELAVRLMADHGMRCDPVWPDLPDVSAADDPRLEPLVRSALGPGTARAAVTVQHGWPPNWNPPDDRAPWVVMQPWESGCLPADWVPALRDLVDEYWVCTEWLRRCAVASGVPSHKVHVVPIGVDSTRLRPDGPRHPLATAAATRFLFVGGAINRKGIDILVDSYLAAFTRADDVCLVLKLSGGRSYYKGSVDAQLRALAARTDVAAIEVIDDDLTNAQMAALYRSCTALVHPYRGEGFAMPIAEAMATGLPVIVTGSGAALDYCRDDIAYLIRAETVRLDPAATNFGPPAGAYWLAEPDRQHLVELLRHVRAHPDEAAAKGAAARRSVADQLDWDAIAAVAAARLEPLARRPARRFDPLGAFDPAVEPTVLDNPRRTKVLVEIDDTGAGAALVRSWVGAVNGDDDVTLVVVGTTEAELDVLADIMRGYDGDVLAVLSGGDDNKVAAAYAACDLVLAGGRRAIVERAGRMGRAAIRGIEPAQIRGEVLAAGEALAGVGAEVAGS